MALRLQSRFCGNVYIIHCAGRIVLGDEVKALEAALDEGAREFLRIVLCMSEAERLDSIGIGLLVRYATRMRKRGGDLRLAAAPPFVTTLLQLTKLSTILPVYATEEEALLSYLRQPLPQDTQRHSGPRVLVMDESADLCAFVKTVLGQQGFDVRSASFFRDAKVLLQVDEVDYILVGPDTAQFCAKTVWESLKKVAPRAATLQLDADFKRRDAGEATEALLELFKVQQPLQG
jgi:anti-anti-sigma factor